MLILGLNAYHADSSACLVRDGSLVAAAEEERFRRVKHWAGFPSEAIRWCLDEAGVRLADVDHIAVNRNPRAALHKRAAFVLRQRPDPRFVLSRAKNASAWLGLEGTFREAFPEGPIPPIHNVEHHDAHLASTFLVSPFNEAVVVSIDGSGDFSTAAWGVGHGSKIEVEGRVHFPHSLGVFYEALTQYLGFPNYGDEYKVMGLAAYGQPTYASELQQLVRLRPRGRFELDLTYFLHHLGRLDYTWNGVPPKVGRLWSDKLADLLGAARDPDEPLEQRHKDIARSAQAVYEAAFFHLLGHLQAKYNVTAISLSGGCAHNSVANGKITTHTAFTDVYMPPAAGDAGGAIGAAYAVLAKVDRGRARSFRMEAAYWGPEFDDRYLQALLSSNSSQLESEGCCIEQISDEGALCDRTAQAISEGKVVGWFQGRMEWGPRALGNRSILGDPRRADMKAILNGKIKRRESFRPFAPSVLREREAEWFEIDDDVPFMMEVFPIREGCRAKVPAVTHVDGSGRLQTVHVETNPRYHRLISSFEKLTGVPMILNTSFNENEPVVCRPEEALDCFLRTKMDVLVMGDRYIERR